MIVVVLLSNGDGVFSRMRPYVVVLHKDGWDKQLLPPHIWARHRRRP